MPLIWVFIILGNNYAVVKYIVFIYELTLLELQIVTLGMFVSFFVISFQDLFKYAGLIF